MPTRNCTAADFGINTTKTKNGFSLPPEENFPIYKRIMYSMRCIDEPLSIQGDWDTATSKVLLLLFERCDPTVRKTCKSDAELMDFLKKKHFIFSYNKLTFLEEEFDDDKVINDFNNLDWLTIDINTPYIRPYKIELSNLERSDSYWPGVKTKPNTFWNLKAGASFPFYGRPNAMGGVLIEMGFDINKISRSVYGFADWLGVVGGFLGSIEFIFQVVVPLVAVWSLEKYLIVSLFHRYYDNPTSDTKHLKKLDHKTRRFEEIKLSLNDRKRIEPSQLPGIIESFRGVLMKCFKSLRYRDEDYFAMKARMRLAKEMDIKRYVQSVRANRNSMKFLTTQRERRIVKMQADKNVLTLQEDDKHKLEEDPEDLSPNELNKLIGDSSAFTSDDYGDYIMEIKE